MKKDSLEVSSDQLKAELIAIKERLGALETIASISNRQVVEAYVREHLKTDKGKQILKECEEPRTRDYLMKKCGFNSAPALDYHLNPLREADLIRQRFDDDGTTQTFEQGNLFKRLPKSSVRKLLDGQNKEKPKTALPGKASAKD
jgi:DNA-binding transcriptional ArsR family regulator